MRLLVILISLLLCVSLAASCTHTPPIETTDDQTTESADDTAKEYTLTMNDPDWLYEPLEPKYKAGDTVVVKIQLAYDLGYLLMLNGVKLYQDYIDENEYWQFTFKMPEQDSALDFKTYDGFLPDVNYGYLYEAYFINYPETENVQIVAYYGRSVFGGIAAIIHGDREVGEVNYSETVGGFTFEYNSTEPITVMWADDRFYSLEEAYENGYISDSDLENIYFLHTGILYD